MEFEMNLPLGQSMGVITLVVLGASESDLATALTEALAELPDLDGPSPLLAENTTAVNRLDAVVVAALDPQGAAMALRAATPFFGTEGGSPLLVWCSSILAYGAWPTPSAPKSAPPARGAGGAGGVSGGLLRPNNVCAQATSAAECERQLAEWRREHQQARVAILRAAPVGGRGLRPEILDALATRIPGASLRSARKSGTAIQLLDVDDLAGAITCVARGGVEGVYDVVVDEGISVHKARALLKRVEGHHDDLAGWQPFLRESWAVGTSDLRDFGWKPCRSSEDIVTHAASQLQVRRQSRRWQIAAVCALAVGAALRVSTRRARGAAQTMRPTRQ